MAKIRTISPYEFKALTSEIKDVDVKNGIVTGYYSAFGNIDSYKDMVVRGAYAKTIAERGPKGTNEILHLLQHDASKPIGKPQVLKEDSFGLYFETKIVGTTIGIDTLKLYEGGVYNQHSVGYRVIKSTYVENPLDPDDYHFELNELKLYEGSTVAWGANPNTPFLDFKCETRDDAFKMIDSKLDTITKALRIPGLSDESYHALEIQSAQIKSLYRQIDSLVIKSEPSTAIDTLNENEPNNKEKAIKEAHDKDVQQKMIEITNNLKNIFK